MAQQTGMSNMADVIRAEYPGDALFEPHEAADAAALGPGDYRVRRARGRARKGTRAAQDRDWYICRRQRQPLTLLPRAP